MSEDVLVGQNTHNGCSQLAALMQWLVVHLLSTMSHAWVDGYVSVHGSRWVFMVVIET